VVGVVRSRGVMGMFNKRGPKGTKMKVQDHTELSSDSSSSDDEGRREVGGPGAESLDVDDADYFDFGTDDEAGVC